MRAGRHQAPIFARGEMRGLPLRRVHRLGDVGCLAIDRTERTPHLAIADHHERPVLRIARRGRAHRGIEDLRDQRLRHRIRLEAPQRPGGMDGLEQSDLRHGTFHDPAFGAHALGEGSPPAYHRRQSGRGCKRMSASEGAAMTPGLRLDLASRLDRAFGLALEIGTAPLVPADPAILFVGTPIAASFGMATLGCLASSHRSVGRTTWGRCYGAIRQPLIASDTDRREPPRGANSPPRQNPLPPAPQRHPGHTPHALHRRPHRPHRAEREGRGDHHRLVSARPRHGARGIRPEQPHRAEVRRPEDQCAAGRCRLREAGRPG